MDTATNKVNLVAFLNHCFTKNLHMKTSGNESWGQEKAAWVPIFRPIQQLQRVIYTDSRSTF